MSTFKGRPVGYADALALVQRERDEALVQRDRARALACDYEAKLARARDSIKAVEPRYYWDDAKLAALAAFDEAVRV
jgi:hypothetical protein